LRPPLNNVAQKWVAQFLDRAWDGNPDNRPSFQEIIEDFSKNKFALLPGVDAVEVGNYLARLQQSEEQ
jgi:hypothetical protein